MQPTPESPLRIGTRKSPLALAQAEMVRSALCIAHGWAEEAVVLVPMLASGDVVQDRPLAEIGGKALWTKELERALLDREIDMAVHSMKDVETQRDASFAIAAMLPRADVRDRLIGASGIADLSQGARVGTSSPRRAAQLLHMRYDLEIVPLRGNVATRLAKIAAGEAGATLLAAAGLDRLDMADTGHAIATEDMLPAAAQGAVGIDILAERDELLELADSINHAETFVCVMAERALLAGLGGNCHSPVAALAQVDKGQIHLRAELYSADGRERVASEVRFAFDDIAAPQALAQRLLGEASEHVRQLFQP